MTTKAKEVKTKNGNGGAPKVDTKNNKAEELKATAETVKAESEAKKNEAAVIPLVSVEERFNKLEEFQALQTKHTKIKAKFQSLKVLKRSNDSLGAEITISAGSEEISMNNAALVGEVLDLLSGKLEAISQETEKEVLSFVI